MYCSSIQMLKIAAIISLLHTIGAILATADADVLATKAPFEPTRSGCHSLQGNTAASDCTEQTTASTNIAGSEPLYQTEPSSAGHDFQNGKAEYGISSRRLNTRAHDPNLQQTYEKENKVTPQPPLNKYLKHLARAANLATAADELYHKQYESEQAQLKTECERRQKEDKQNSILTSALKSEKKLNTAVMRGQLLEKDVIRTPGRHWLLLDVLMTRPTEGRTVRVGNSIRFDNDILVKSYATVAVNRQSQEIPFVISEKNMFFSHVRRRWTVRTPRGTRVGSLELQWYLSKPKTVRIYRSDTSALLSEEMEYEDTVAEVEQNEQANDERLSKEEELMNDMQEEANGRRSMYEYVMGDNFGETTEQRAAWNGDSHEQDDESDDGWVYEGHSSKRRLTPKTREWARQKRKKGHIPRKAGDTKRHVATVAKVVDTTSATSTDGTLKAYVYIYDDVEFEALRTRHVVPLSQMTYEKRNRKADGATDGGVEEDDETPLEEEEEGEIFLPAFGIFEKCGNEIPHGERHFENIYKYVRDDEDKLFTSQLLCIYEIRRRDFSLPDHLWFVDSQRASAQIARVFSDDLQKISTVMKLFEDSRHDFLMTSIVLAVQGIFNKKNANDPSQYNIIHGLGKRLAVEGAQVGYEKFAEHNPHFRPPIEEDITYGPSEHRYENSLRSRGGLRYGGVQGVRGELNYGRAPLGHRGTLAYGRHAYGERGFDYGEKLQRHHSLGRDRVNEWLNDGGRSDRSYEVSDSEDF